MGELPALPSDLARAGWVLHKRGNALLAHNWRWGIQSIEVASPRRGRGRKAQDVEVPNLLMTWLRDATSTIQGLEVEWAAALPEAERAQLRTSFQIRQGIAVVEVIVATWRWLLYRAGDAWRLAAARDPLHYIDIINPPRAWHILRAADQQPPDRVEPRILFALLRARLSVGSHNGTDKPEGLTMDIDLATLEVAAPRLAERLRAQSGMPHTIPADAMLQVVLHLIDGLDYANAATRSLILGVFDRLGLLADLDAATVYPTDYRIRPELTAAAWAAYLCAAGGDMPGAIAALGRAVDRVQEEPGFPQHACARFREIIQAVAEGRSVSKETLQRRESSRVPEPLSEAIVFVVEASNRSVSSASPST